MSNTLKFGNGEWYGKKDTILAYNDENSNFKPLPFSFDRASSATVINKDGLIETVGSGEPRIDYKDDSKGALLLEPTRSNKVTYSEDFSDSSWNKLSNVAITPNTTISPIGFLDADTCTFTTFGTQTQLYKVVSTSGSIQTISIFIKYLSGSGTNVRLSISSPSTKGVNLTFSNNGETLSAVKGTSVNDFSIEKHKNNWFRVSISVSHSDSSTEFNLFKFSGSETDSYAIWGAQIESNQSFQTSYIPTQGGAVTRVADVCNNGGNEQVINSTKGVLYAEIASLVNLNATPTTISISDGTSTNFTEFRYDATLNNLQYYLVVGGTYYFNNTTPLNDIKDFLKVAIKWKVNDFSIWVNGIEVDTATGSVWIGNTLDRIDFAEPNGTNSFRGKTKDVRVYNTALTDQELINLTTI